LQVILRAVDPTMVALEVPWFWPVWSPALASRSAVYRGQAGAAARLPDRAEATAAVLRLPKTRTVQSVVIDPRSPGATLIKPLTDAEVTVTRPSTSDVTVAHGTFLDERAAGRLRHAEQPELGAQRRRGGATAWQRHAGRRIAAVRCHLGRLGSALRPDRIRSTRERLVTR
jgi:hypothetical protein